MSMKLEEDMQDIEPGRFNQEQNQVVNSVFHRALLIVLHQ
jgi:hypothetical protein